VRKKPQHPFQPSSYTRHPRNESISPFRLFYWARHHAMSAINTSEIPKVGSVDPWESDDPLRLTLNHFTDSEDGDVCPECGWDAESHVLWDSEWGCADWKCPDEPLTLMERLAQIPVAEGD
jgi:hypothetical protein